MEKNNIPELNSLDSMEGLENNESSKSQEQMMFVVDFESPASTPEGLEILSEEEQPVNRVRGQVSLSVEKLEECALFLSTLQATGNIRDMSDKLKSYEVFGSQLIDYLIQNQNLIPKLWLSGGDVVYAWGTHYKGPAGVYVRGMMFDNGKWDETKHRIKGDYCQNEIVLINKEK